MKQLTFWSEEPLASPFLSPESEVEWMTRVVNWPLGFAELLLSTAPDGSSGKTSMASYHRDEAGILAPLSNRWLTAGMAAPGECWTLSISESPSEEKGCFLSQILQAGEIPAQYYLTEKACKGMLRRLEYRGKELNPMVMMALRFVAGDVE